MCIGIYLALIALFLFYSHTVIEQYALSITSGEGDWMMIALGWEIVLEIWPMIVLSMVIASAVTLFVTLKVKGKASCCDG